MQIDFDYYQQQHKQCSQNGSIGEEGLPVDLEENPS